jgi:hypothetical protein
MYWWSPWDLHGCLLGDLRTSAGLIVEVAGELGRLVPVHQTYSPVHLAAYRVEDLSQSYFRCGCY